MRLLQAVSTQEAERVMCSDRQADEPDCFPCEDYFISTASPGNARKRDQALSRRDTATAMSPEFEIEAQSSSPSAAVRKRKISTPDRPLDSARLCGSGFSACPRLGNLKMHQVGRARRGLRSIQLTLETYSVLISNPICKVAEDVQVVAQPSIAETLMAQPMSLAFPGAV